MKKRRIKIGKRVVLMFAATVITIVGSIGGSMAWLSDTTPQAVHSMTLGGISAGYFDSKSNQTFNLRPAGSETDPTLRLIPGATLEVNAPPVVIDEGSGDCYLFLHLKEDIGSLPAAEFGRYLQYGVADGWIPAEGENIPRGVYYQIVYRGQSEHVFETVKEGSVKVSDALTENELSLLTNPGSKMPGLTLNAYAIQLSGDGITPFTVAEAWANLGISDSTT